MPIKNIAMLNSLRFKIIFTAFLIISAIMTLSTWNDIRHAEKKLIDKQKEKAVLLSERIAHGVMVLMLNKRWQDLGSFLESLTKDSKELTGIYIVNPEVGSIRLSSSRNEIGLQMDSAAREIMESGNMKEAFLTERAGIHYASRLTPIQNQPSCYTCHGTERAMLGVLGVDISLNEVQQSIRELKIEHLLHTIVVLVLITGSFLLIIGLLINRPIKKMISSIAEIEQGHLDSRMDDRKKDEFGLVARSFNRMVQSLQSANDEIEACHSAQMERASKLASLGEIISGIAHEIKNPLTGISCAVQVLQSEMGEGDRRRDTTAEILSHISRLDRTVKGLLNYSKPKPPHFAPQKIEDVISKAVFFVYPEARKHSVAIEMNTDEHVPEVMMDPDQMQQVFLNLMINAVQAMPDGGRLKIAALTSDKEAMEHSVLTGIPVRAVAVQFEDTGEGIGEESVENIFDPFFTKKSKGTGLGLAISRRIIEEHGGEIAVKSEPGSGSTFTVLLPAAGDEMDMDLEG